MELAVDCMIYLKTEAGEDLHTAYDRLTRILLGVGLDINTYKIELRDKDGNVVEEE